jgi:hypothetical protein
LLHQFKELRSARWKSIDSKYDRAAWSFDEAHRVFAHHKDYGSLLLRTMRYSLRRALSLDSVDGGTHNPTIFGGGVHRLRRRNVEIRSDCDPAVLPKLCPSAEEKTAQDRTK